MQADTSERLTHELEQHQAALRDISPVLAAFKAQLLRDGFTQTEALRLTRDAFRYMHPHGGS